jgi:hypothetical protein
MRLTPDQHSKAAWELKRQAVAKKADPEAKAKLERAAENHRFVAKLGRAQRETKAALDKEQQQAARK